MNKENVLMTITTKTLRKYDITKPQPDNFKLEELRENFTYDVIYLVMGNCVRRHTGRLIQETDLCLEFEDVSRMHYDIIDEPLIVNGNIVLDKDKKKMIVKQVKVPRASRISIPIRNIVEIKIAD